MSISLPSEFEQFVAQEIANGAYQSETEVVCAGLDLLQRREKRLQAIRAQVLPALERLDRGEGIELDDDSLDQFFADIVARGDVLT
jgi:putative addiction module CopG family antidote